MDDVALSNLVTGLSRDHIEAGRIPLALAKRIGAKTTVVYLSDYTVTKQRFHHKDIDFSHYCALTDVLNHGFVIHDGIRGANHLIFIHKDEERSQRWFRAAVRSTLSGEEMFLDSFHKLRPSDARRLYRRAMKEGTLIRGSNVNWRLRLRAAS